MADLHPQHPAGLTSGATRDARDHLRDVATHARSTGALGFGFQERITADLIKEMCDFYRSQSTPIGILQLAPAGLPDN
jgi:hypothetical protein